MAEAVRLWARLSREDWADLRARYQSTDEAGVLEARDCLCGSTLCVYLAILDPDVAAEEL